jgi:hypothetical protein
MLLLSITSAFIGLTGCQNLGNYSAQSVTRVPPIGTGTYQASGSYYGNPSTNAVSANASTSNAGLMNPPQGLSNSNMPSGMPTTTLTNAANIPSTAPVSTAGYTAPSTDFGNAAMTNAPNTASAAGNGNLQWQR